MRIIIMSISCSSSNSNKFSENSNNDVTLSLYFVYFLLITLMENYNKKMRTVTKE